MISDKSGQNRAGTLHIVATPIGNLGDMPPRAVEVLKNVDFIAAEDTRVTSILLARFEIKTPMVSYHKFNEKGQGEAIIERILKGQSCALVTDAGTPSVSDPGAVLTDLAANSGICVTGVPGPSAVSLALSLSGFSASSYGFYGFPPKGAAVRQSFLKVLEDGPAAAVFFESPYRIMKTLEVLEVISQEKGNGIKAVLCNDLTKKFETVYRGSPAEILKTLKTNPNAHKGEYTLVIKKNKTLDIAEADKPEMFTEMSIEARLVDLCVKQSLTLKEAITHLHEQTQEFLPKKELYAASLRLKKML